MKSTQKQQNVKIQLRCSRCSMMGDVEITKEKYDYHKKAVEEGYTSFNLSNFKHSFCKKCTKELAQSNRSKK